MPHRMECAPLEERGRLAREALDGLTGIVSMIPSQEAIPAEWIAGLLAGISELVADALPEPAFPVPAR